MLEGLLWYDADPNRSLAAKLDRAAFHYRRKYGSAPDACHVHPSMLNGDAEIDTIRLVPDATVQVNYFWIGEEAGVTLHGRRNGNGHAPEPETEPELETEDLRTAANSAQMNARFTCRHCEAEVIDPQATACWSCGYDGRE